MEKEHKMIVLAMPPVDRCSLILPCRVLSTQEEKDDMSERARMFEQNNLTSGPFEIKYGR